MPPGPVRGEGSELPAAALATKMIVTGTVVGVGDLVKHTISLVNPSGGIVHTFDVTDPGRQAALETDQSGRLD